MKKQILTFIIGILVGSIITTVVFLVLKGNGRGKGDIMNRGERPSFNGEFPQMENGAIIPEKMFNLNAQKNLNNI